MGKAGIIGWNNVTNYGHSCVAFVATTCKKTGRLFHVEFMTILYKFSRNRDHTNPLNQLVFRCHLTAKCGFQAQMGRWDETFQLNIPAGQLEKLVWDCLDELVAVKPFSFSAREDSLNFSCQTELSRKDNLARLHILTGRKCNAIIFMAVRDWHKGVFAAVATCIRH